MVRREWTEREAACGSARDLAVRPARGQPGLAVSLARTSRSVRFGPDTAEPSAKVSVRFCRLAAQKQTVRSRPTRVSYTKSIDHRVLAGPARAAAPGIRWRACGLVGAAPSARPHDRARCADAVPPAHINRLRSGLLLPQHQ